MRLYRNNNVVSVVPGTDPNHALDYYEMIAEGQRTPSPEDLEVIIPHEDFIKIFRLARMLNSIDQYTYENVETITLTYAKQLGYDLSSTDLWNGILVWVERFEDANDEDIECWIN